MPGDDTHDDSPGFGDSPVTPRSHKRLDSILDARARRTKRNEARRGSSDPLLRHGSSDTSQSEMQTFRSSTGKGDDDDEGQLMKSLSREGVPDAATFLSYEHALDIDLMAQREDDKTVLSDTRQNAILRFQDPDVEAAYRQDFLARSVSRLQFLLFLSILFHIAYGLSDIFYVSAPTHIYLIRLAGLLPLHAIVAALSFTAVWRHHLVWYSTVGIVLANAAFFIVYASTRGVGLYSDEISPPTTLSLFFVILFTFVRMDLLVSVALCLLTMAGYVTLFAVQSYVSSIELLGHGLILLCALIIGFVSGYMMERSSRATFMEIVTLEERHEHILDRKKRTADLMLNILPAPVASRLIDNRLEETVCDRYSNVTVMFVDVQGLSKTGTPQDIVEELNHIFEVFDEIILQFGGEKIKSIGSVYMVAAGVPIPNNQHAVVIAKIALNMMYAMEDMNARHGMNHIELMIGINSGEVVAGVIGTNKYCFDIYGDTVNSASRMESTSLAGNIQLSESSYLLLKASGAGFMMQKRGEIYVKGKGRVKTYWLLGEKARADRPILLPMNDPRPADDRVNHPELFNDTTESSSEESSDSGSQGYEQTEAYVESFAEIDQREKAGDGTLTRGMSSREGEQYDAHRRQAIADVSRFRDLIGQNEEFVLFGRDVPKFFFSSSLEKRFLARYFRELGVYVRLVLLTGAVVHGVLAFAEEQYGLGEYFYLWIGMSSAYVLVLLASLLPWAPVTRNVSVSLFALVGALAAIPILAILTPRTTFFRSLLILQICFIGTCIRVHTIPQAVLLFATLGTCMPFVDDSINIGSSVGYVPILVAIGNIFTEYYVRRDHLLTESMKAEEQNLEKEKTKSDDLLLNVLPRSVVDELKQGLDSRQFTSIATQHPSASILFSDLVGFTALSSTMQAKELVAILNEIFSEFDRSCLDLGLEKIKTIGDAFFCVGGIFDSDTTDFTRGEAAKNMTHAEASCQQALEMMQSLNHFNKKNPDLGLRMRIGLHYGPVMGGVIGTRKFIFDVWGEAVDTAEHMESSGIPGRIQVSAAMYKQVKDSFRFEKRERPKSEKGGKKKKKGNGKGGANKLVNTDTRGSGRRQAIAHDDDDSSGFLSGFFSGFSSLFDDDAEGGDHYDSDDGAGPGDGKGHGGDKESDAEDEPTYFLLDRL